MTKLSVSGWACSLQPWLSAPKRRRLRVTHYDETTEVRGKTCLCSLFPTRLEATGAEPQDGGLPSGPPWDWCEPVRRGSQAAPLTVTLGVRCQHRDSLVNTSFMVLTVPPSDMSARTRPGVFPRAERRVLVGMCCGAVSCHVFFPLGVLLYRVPKHELQCFIEIVSCVYIL